MKRVSLIVGSVGLSLIGGFILYRLAMVPTLITLGIVAFFVIAGLITNWWVEIRNWRGGPLFWSLGATIWGLLALFIIVTSAFGFMGWDVWWEWLIVGIVSFISYLIFVARTD